MSEDNLLHDLENLFGEKKETHRSQFSFSTIFSLFVLNWHYFLLSLLICVVSAWLYLRYTEPTYSISARLLIKSEDNRRIRNASQMLSNMMDGGFMSKSAGIENEIEVLKSRVLIREVVKDLKLYVEYRSVSQIVKPLVYQTRPLNVELDPLHLDSLPSHLCYFTFQTFSYHRWEENYS